MPKSVAQEPVAQEPVAQTGNAETGNAGTGDAGVGEAGIEAPARAAPGGELHFLWLFGFPAVAIVSMFLPVLAEDHIDSKVLGYALYVFAVSAALIFCMTWRSGGGRVTIAAALTAGLLFALSGFLAVEGYGWKSPTDIGQELLFFGQVVFLIFALLPLLQARLETGSWSWRREPFRTHAWNNGCRPDDDRDDEFASREVPDQDGMRDPSRIILIPPDLELPDVFFRGGFVNSFVSTASCRLDDGPGCLIAAAEITDGDGDEYLLAVRRPGAGTEVWLMERHGAHWQSTKLVHPIGDPELWETLVQGDMATIPANHHDLRIGGQVIRLRDLYP